MEMLSWMRHSGDALIVNVAIAYITHENASEDSEIVGGERMRGAAHAMFANGCK